VFLLNTAVVDSFLAIFFQTKTLYRCYSRIEVIVPVFSSKKKYIIRAKISIINQNTFAFPSVLFAKAEKSYFLPVKN